MGVPVEVPEVRSRKSVPVTVTVCGSQVRRQCRKSFHVCRVGFQQVRVIVYCCPDSRVVFRVLSTLRVLRVYDESPVDKESFYPEVADISGIAGKVYAFREIINATAAGL